MVRRRATPKAPAPKEPTRRRNGFRTAIAIVMCLVWLALLLFSAFSKSAAAALAIATPVMLTATGFLFNEPGEAKA